MPPPEIRAIAFPSLRGAPPLSGTIEVSLDLADGSSSRFWAATPEQAESWIGQPVPGCAFKDPVLFARTLDPDLLRTAVEAMALELGGYWLRYYNSDRKRPPQKPAKVARAELGSVESSSAVVQVAIEDGRIFSILTATPLWFQSAWENHGLDYYFGPCVLFLREMSGPLALRAVSEMAAQGDRLLCLYDTPRTTLSQVLADFKARHP